jgi:hypothetical protein
MRANARVWQRFLERFTTPTPVNVSSDTLNIQISMLETLNNAHKNLKISEQELQQIITLGNAQLAATGKVIRGQIVKALNGNSHTSRKVKVVCDFMGWGLSMSKDKLSPEQWEAIKQRDNYTCQKCKRREPEITLEPDRIIPAIKGGKYEPDNV